MPSIATSAAFARIRNVIADRGAELAALPGVVEVWPGFKFRSGRLTSTPALMVSVLSKVPESKLKPGALLPKKLDGVVVDVVPASPGQMLRFAMQHGRKLTANTAAELAGMVAGGMPGVADVAAAAAGVPLVPYVPSAPPLKEVNETMQMVCHASPDAGWRVLSDFFGRTEKRLTATMYEFTAVHILERIREVMTLPRKLDFIMDGGNSENEKARAELKKSLKKRMTFAWAAVADSGKVTKAFFPTAYHIKVAVRDGKEFWLSSGNWKDSNQPQRDPVNKPFPKPSQADAFHRRQNRDWHVVVENPALAEQLERFIRHDIAQAAPFQLPAAPPGIAEVPQEFFVAAVLADAGGVEFFAEKVFDKELRVVPLLTPDNYVNEVLPLLEKAEHSVYFQNQSLSAAISNPRYRKLAETLRDLSNRPASKMDVRIIVRGDFEPHRILSSLAMFGFNMKRVKLMRGNHNKGILIDDKVTVLGSHNWTGQGTTQNRDASLIIHDAEVTAYYTRLFQHDWNRRSTAEVPASASLAVVADAGAPAPAGMVRLTAREILDGCPPDLF